jgi:hypothetical protein
MSKTKIPTEVQKVFDLCHYFLATMTAQVNPNQEAMTEQGRENHRTLNSLCEEWLDSVVTRY